MFDGLMFTVLEMMMGMGWNCVSIVLDGLSHGYTFYYSDWGSRCPMLYNILEIWIHSYSFEDLIDWDELLRYSRILRIRNMCPNVFMML